MGGMNNIDTLARVNIVAAALFSIICSSGLGAVPPSSPQIDSRRSAILSGRSNFLETMVIGSQGRQQWRRITLRCFSVRLPNKVKPGKHGGIDSMVWRYDSKSLDLTIDLGRYSGEPASRDEVEYREENKTIDGKDAILSYYRLRNMPSDGKQMIAEAHFRDIGESKSGLTFRTYCKTNQDLEIAKTIFASIRFGRTC